MGYAHWRAALLSLFLVATAAHAQSPPPQEYALEFEVNLVATAPVDLPAEFTMEGWIFLKSLPTSPGSVLGKSHDTLHEAVSYFIEIGTDGRVAFVQATTLAPRASAASPTPIPLRVWTHVSATVGGGMTRLFINGQQVAATPVIDLPPFPPTNLPDNSEPFSVGGNFVPGSQPNPGRPGPVEVFGCCGASVALREARVWSRALSAGEIQLMMGATLMGNEPGLLSNWPLDDAIGQQARNVLGGGPILQFGAQAVPDELDPRWIRNATLENGPFFVLEGPFVLPNLDLDNGTLIDFDNDGDLDAIVQTQDDDLASLDVVVALRNDGTGQFTEDSLVVFAGQTINTFGANFDFYQARDFTGDGLTDLFVPRGGPDLPPFTGAQNLLFVQSPAGQLLDETSTRLPSILDSPHNSAAGDIDNDGDVDLFTCAVCCGADHSLDVNDGTGHFTSEGDRLSPQLFLDPNQPHGGFAVNTAAFADIDRDGDLDLVLGGPNPDFEHDDWVYLNDGTGHFTRAPREVTPRQLGDQATLGIESADFDGDGWPDLIEITRSTAPPPPGASGDQLRLLLNNQDGTFREATERLPLHWQDLLLVGLDNIHVVDLNQDGRLDVVVEGTGGTRQRLFLNQGWATFIDATELLPADSPCGQCDPGLPPVNSLLPGDLDGDGDIDFFANTKDRTYVIRNVKSLITASTDLGLTLVDSVDPAVVGVPLTYTATIINNGPDNATATQLIDTLPATVDFVSAIPSQGTCGGTTTLTCNLGGIASGAGATVQITVVPTSTATLINTAIAINSTGLEIDPDASNNLATELTQVMAPPPMAPVPLATSLSPTTIPAGSPGFDLFVHGASFSPNAVVRWNGADRTTAPAGGGRLKATILASDVANVGTAQVTVFNPAPGGGTSNSRTFTITLRNPLPTVTGLAPAGAVGGAAGFMLDVSGSNFVFNSEVRWDGAPRTTTFVSSNLLQALIPATDLEMADIGAHPVTVFNPGPGGGTSNAVNFSVLNMANPAPTLASIDPTQATAGAVRDALTLTLTGANFVNASVVRWNGMDRLTSFVNANQLMATIPASDLVAAGAAAVTVFNPAAGGGISSPQVFTINNPAPTLDSLNPNAAMVGDPAFTLTVLGANFLPSSAVRRNGSPRPTSFIGSNQLRAAIPASDVASEGMANVTVFTPIPGGGESAPVPFTINAPMQAGVTSAPSSAAPAPPRSGLDLVPARRNSSAAETNPPLIAQPAAPPSRASLPVIEALRPATIAAGSSTLKLTVRGENFTEQSLVRWKGKDLPTKFLSRTELEVELPADALAQPGQLELTVFTPGPGGGSSRPATLTVTDD